MSLNVLSSFGQFKLLVLEDCKGSKKSARLSIE